jgi:putative CocE/NonD family hydrolase
MSLSSIVLARLYGLPPRLYGTTRRRDIALPMDDGVTLMTDVYSPRVEGPHPTILMRLPYGRHGFGTVAECYAERGFHVVLQACRGTEKSGGEFDPLVNERADGLATLRWIKAQDWYDGRLGLSGPSYLGYAQWAICDELPEISAMATKVTSAEFQSVVFPSGAFHLGLWLSWLQVIEGLRGNPLKMSGTMFSGGVEKRTARAAMTLPLLHADNAAVGHDVPFWQSWFESAIGNDEFWKAIDHRHRLGPKTPPNHFISGWYDFMLDQLLRDYQTLVDFGHTPHLTVGPWTHIANDLQAESMRETLVWMRAQLLGDSSGLREKPVRIHISGLNEWREYDRYPPGSPGMQSWFIGSGGALTKSPVAQPASDRYHYDPAHPTPNIGGNMFAFTGAGPVDNAPRENRADVLSYTSEPLEEGLTIIGQTRVTLRARATVPNVDFFLRLCDVGLTGISTNVCDGLFRVTPQSPRDPDGSWRLDFTLHAAAHSFRPGHRLRLQVSSGAHPRYARNLGTDEPVGTATRMVANDVEIFHDGSVIGLATYAV